MTTTVTVRSLAIGDGTSYRIDDWGILADPEEVTNDLVRSDRGAMAGRDGDGPRRLWFNVLIATDTVANMIADFADLDAAWARQEEDTSLVLSLEGTSYTYFGRTRGADGSSGVRLPTRCEFLATDPRRFGAEVTATVGTDLTVTNSGTRPGIWQWTIAGPQTNPTLEIGTFELAYTGTIASGKSLVVSRRLGTAIYDGASVADNLTDENGHNPAELADLPVGASALSGTSGGVLVYRSAW